MTALVHSRCALALLPGAAGGCILVNTTSGEEFVFDQDMALGYDDEGWAFVTPCDPADDTPAMWVKDCLKTHVAIDSSGKMFYMTAGAPSYIDALQRRWATRYLQLGVDVAGNTVPLTLVAHRLEAPRAACWRFFHLRDIQDSF